jgi:hypothetical protein
MQASFPDFLLLQLLLHSLWLDRRLRAQCVDETRMRSQYMTGTQ